MPLGPGGVPCREIDMIDLKISVKIDLRQVTKLLLAICLVMAR